MIVPNIWRATLEDDDGEQETLYIAALSALAVVNHCESVRPDFRVLSILEISPLEITREVLDAVVDGQSRNRA